MKVKMSNLASIAVARAIVRLALSNLAKSDRMLNTNMPNKQLSEIAIEQGSEELTNAANKILDATTEFLKICTQVRDEMFFKDLKL